MLSGVKSTLVVRLLCVSFVCIRGLALQLCVCVCVVCASVNVSWVYVGNVWYEYLIVG